MPRPKKHTEEMTPLGFRLPNQLIDRIDAFCERAKQASGFVPSRSEAIRVLLERGLTTEGFAHKGQTKPKRRAS